MSKFVEMQILGQCMLDTDTRAIEGVLARGVMVDHFSSEERKLVFLIVKRLYEAGSPVDALTVGDELRKEGVNPEFLEDIVKSAPGSPVLLPNPIEELREAYELRWLENQLGVAQELIDEGEVEKAKEALAECPTQNSIPKTKRRSELKPAPVNAPDELIQQRFLNFFGILLIAGGSGIGKSVFVMQVLVCLACALPVFGLKPTRPMKIVYVQAENDEGEMHDMLESVATSVPGVDENLLNENVRFVIDREHRGKQFGTMVRQFHREEEFDILVADPAFSYFGGDASSQGEVSAWLRGHVNPLLESLGIALILVAHTPKISGKQEKGKFGSNRYAVFGSTEWTNVPRAIIWIEPIAPGHCKLHFAKGHGRLPSGSPHTLDIIHGGGEHEATGRKKTWWKVAEPEDLLALKLPKKKGPTKQDRILKAVIAACRQAKKVLYRMDIILRADAHYEIGNNLYDLSKDAVKRKALSEFNSVIELQIAPNTQQRQDGSWPENQCPLSALLIGSVNRNGQKMFHQWVCLRDHRPTLMDFKAILDEAVASVLAYHRNGERLPVGGQDIAPQKPGKAYSIVYSPDHRFDKSRKVLETNREDLDLPEGDGEL